MIPPPNTSFKNKINDETPNPVTEINSMTRLFIFRRNTTDTRVASRFVAPIEMVILTA